MNTFYQHNLVLINLFYFKQNYKKIKKIIKNRYHKCITFVSDPFIFDKDTEKEDKILILCR